MKNPFYHYSEVVQKMREGWELSWVYCTQTLSGKSEFFLTNHDSRDFRFVKVHKNIARHLLVTEMVVVCRRSANRQVEYYRLRELVG
jgi:hypothetical protein